MAWTKNIEITKPLDTGESPSLGASRIRDWKNAVCERLTNWIYSFKTDDSETKEGLKKAPLNTGSAPTQEADKIIVYAKDVAGVAELFARDENGNEIQITSVGKVNLAAGDHGALGGLADDDHSQYHNDSRFISAHDVTTRHPISVLKISTGSFSESVASQNYSSAFSFSPYAHLPQIKTSYADKGVALQSNSSGGTYPIGCTFFAPTTSYDLQSKLYNPDGNLRTLYAQWYYHSASKQAIWAVWDKNTKKLICVLVEEDEGFCKLHPELKENQILVKFKNPNKFLKEEFNSTIDKVKNKEEKLAKIKNISLAGYILENTQITDDDVEEIK